MTLELAISVGALIVSFFALLWNAIRDLVVDRVKLVVDVNVGTIASIAGIKDRAMFVGAGEDIGLKHASTDPLIMFSIINAGRRPVAVSKILGKFKKPEQTSKAFWILNTRRLPTMIQPYEVHTETCEDAASLRNMANGNISDIWVEDTKGRRWKISRKKIRRVAQQASVVVQDKQT